MKRQKYPETERILRTDALGAYRLNTYRHNNMTYYLLFNSKTRISYKKKNRKVSKSIIQKNQNKMKKALEERKKKCRIYSNFWFVPNAYMKESDIRRESDYPFEN